MGGGGGDNSSHQSLVPLKRCSNTSGEEANEHKKRKCPPAAPYFAGLAADTFITRLKIYKWRGRKFYYKEDYSHLLCHCVQHPTTLTALSDLPDHLISLVLSSLDLRQAVRTSILSKRWRYLWSFMPSLSLPIFESADAITHILKLFKSPRVGLLRFHVAMLLGRTFPTSQEIDTWLALACFRHVKDMVLGFNFLNALPSYKSSMAAIKHWFTHVHSSPGFSNIKRLTLRFCMIGPPASQCLTSLEYLALEKVLLEDNMIQELTSSCPMLGELKLRECNYGVPLRVSITNPKTSKLNIYDRSYNTELSSSNFHPLLELHAPYLSTLVIFLEVGRRYKMNVPSLSTLKFADFVMRGVYTYETVSDLKKILSGLNTKELYLCSMAVQYLVQEYTTKGRILAPQMMINVKCLHIQAEKFPQELPGWLYLLKYCVGVDTLVVDFQNMYESREVLDISKHLRYLKCSSTAVLKNTDKFVIKGKEELVCLNDEDSWSSLRYLLSCQLPDLKCIEINGFKRMCKVEDACKSDFPPKDCYYVVDKYEFKLLRILLNYALGLESIAIRTKDIYLIGDQVDGAIGTDKYKNIYLNGEVNKMEISQWDKVLMSLPRGSPRAKINVTSHFMSN